MFKPLEEREEFWPDMRDILVKCDRNKRIVILGYINGTLNSITSKVAADQVDMVLLSAGDVRYIGISSLRNQCNLNKRHSSQKSKNEHTEYIPATFHDVNTAVCKTSRTKEVRPSDLCKDAPRCPDEPNKEAFNDARWMTGHVGHPRPPSASHAPQTSMFQTKEP
ncbi:hypothetical protein EVAR_62151_1 [Eumeta japonica]|uniref:Uncharacterized protein n=1 Tax=Eumeta variegata TaxID=151549 RepID=A0A4C1ZXJ7_EUMVA|nr:hypothetical protein EVAR_62151_1 [Eumeta japonica]